MKKQFEDWHLYIGMPMVYQNLNYSSDSKFNGKKTRLSHLNFASQVRDIKEGILTPILRPLSSITKKEWREILLCGRDVGFYDVAVSELEEHMITYTYYKKLNGVMFPKKWEPYTSALTCSEAFAKALEFKADLFELIRTGQAIDATKMDVNP